MLHSEFVRARQSGSSRLLIMLHGLGDSLEGNRWLPSLLDLPWMNYLLVNAPDTYFGGYSWYDFTGDITPGVLRSRNLLFELLDYQRARGFPTEQTTLLGFSQGCLMSIEVALRYPRLFAGVVGISGYVCNPEVLLRELSPVAARQRLLVTHGYLDPIIPFAVVRKQVATLQAAALNIAWHEFVKPHTIAGESELRLIRNFIQLGYGEG